MLSVRESKLESKAGAGWEYLGLDVITSSSERYKSWLPEGDDSALCDLMSRSGFVSPCNGAFI